MKKIKLLLIPLLLVGSLLTSCNDDEPSCDFGTVRFTNNSSDTYDLYIDGVYKTRMTGNTFIEYDLSEGQHSARVEQINGFIFFPTTQDITLNVFGCQETSWVFP